MADWFSRMYIQERVGVPITGIKQERYDEAGALVSKLLEIDRYGIRKMREEEPDTRKITKSLILKYYPTIPEEVAARLARTFLNGVKDTPKTIEQYISEVGERE